ncbi:MAG: DUF362 domain-containing protein, partial [Thermodesulfobacteriota bacterium]|nr:DUF362 domain-containing protein [Thermodesulfobacteriota bacterium]
MTKKIDRRTFISKSSKVALSTFVGGSMLPYLYTGTLTDAQASEKTDVTAVTGGNYFNNTIKAVELLGGMNKFVTKGSKVGLLINSSFEKPGTYVMTDVTLAVLKMCYGSGAKEIVLLNKSSSQEYWNRSSLSKEFQDEIKSLQTAGKTFVKKEIPQGKTLKEAQIVTEFMECDIFINMPKTKDHAGTNFTGNMKNMMGVTSHETNGFFHFGSSKTKTKDYYSDVQFLSQCIADVNLIRKPDLCIADATELITTNGPFGPGKIIKPQQVIA